MRNPWGFGYDYLGYGNPYLPLRPKEKDRQPDNGMSLPNLNTINQFTGGGAGNAAGTQLVSGLGGLGGTGSAAGGIFGSAGSTAGAGALGGGVASGSTLGSSFASPWAFGGQAASGFGAGAGSSSAGGLGGLAGAGWPALLVAGIALNENYQNNIGNRDGESFPLEYALSGRALYKDAPGWADKADSAIPGLGDGIRVAGLTSSPIDLFRGETYSDLWDVAKGGGLIGSLLGL